MALRLPMDEHLDDVVAALRRRRQVVVEAPPGAGKTTRVPPALAAAFGEAGRVVVLEPRRVAARAAASRMADERGESVGSHVGITTRGDRRVSRDTVVEVVTEGVLLNRLQRDPSLPGIGTVVLDEFHERSLDADLSLAFATESQEALRDDLRVVVMSATLDGERVARLLDDAPVVRTEGRTHPVEVRHRDVGPTPDLTATTTTAVHDVLAEVAGDVLVFLPGSREIRDVVDRLRREVPGDVDVRPLYGALDAAEQDAALAASPPGRRKVVVATDIAESSVTVSGVRAVVDTGWSREPRYRPGSGMSRLVTVPASVASADQRAGRAGREAPGLCLRLWSLADHVRRDADARPGMVTDDLTRAALEVAAWGADVGDLRLLDAPDPTAWRGAHEVLGMLGALDDTGITTHGRTLARMPLHPRVAHLVEHARDRALGATGVALAAVLTERDPITDRDDRDLRSRVEVVAGRGTRRIDHGALAAVRRERDRLARRLDLPTEPVQPDAVGALTAVAFPDRVAARRPARGEYTLASGRGVRLSPRNTLAASELLVVADADDTGTRAWVWSAAPVTHDELRDHLGDLVAWHERVAWDHDRDEVTATRQERLGGLVLAEAPLAEPSPERVVEAIIDGVRSGGLDLLPWTTALRSVRSRAAFLHRELGEPWPAVDDATLLDGLEAWLAPFLTSVRRLRDVSGDQLQDALGTHIGWQRMSELDRLAPPRVTIPSGRSVAVDYPPGGAPTIAAKLQEFLGPSPHPTAAGRPLVVELLSPAGRPVQVTSDLPQFWRTTYADVRADLRGRYPKHPWPSDPTSAVPTARTKRAMGR